MIPRVFDWSEIPIAGKSLIVAAYFQGVNGYSEKVPYFRIFDADGVEIVDTFSTRESPQIAIDTLGTRLDQFPSTKDLPVAEKNRIVTTVISLADPSALEKIQELQKSCEKLWSREEHTRAR